MELKDLTVVLGVVVAVATLRTNIGLARRKQSSDLVFAGRDDQSFVTGIRLLRKFKASGDIASFATSANAMSEDAIKIRYVLNYFEALAIGVRKSIYDEDILYLNYKTTVKHMMGAATPYIRALRSNQDVPSLYCELTWLADRWHAAEHSTFAQLRIAITYSRILRLVSKGRIDVRP
ncbi:DUF4760 domain-containing protein [Stenotrophomonas sp. 169]|uniref:DUF4760 domain-containing protein n=1 Tax=Stenotrophomonas sp. 169 TaxID=2770322 RepID=UPI0016624502|nr:DUF4760 domain-containing protein [Stenotrophomonas sp. 169]QNR96645.1 DUF4760 domain-containing protein [Stenotrophomonas sp. 169]